MLEDLILFYIVTKVVASKEMALETLVTLTNENNYDFIASFIQNSKYASESDLARYMNMISLQTVKA